MNEPQLSEKLNRKFHDLFFPYDETFVFPDDPERIKHFLATALEEERAKVLSEVEKLLIEHFAGSGELFFPYVGCGASSKADEREFAKQVILDALGRKRVYDKK